MNVVRRKLKALRKSLQKGFTLIELAIVGLFLGLLAVFAITQFSGSATDNTRANGLFEATTKMGDNWALVAQQCGVSSDITATVVSAGTAATTQGKNLSMLLGNVGAVAAYQSCVASSGIRPLNGLSTGVQGSEAIQSYPVALGTATVNGRTAVTATYSGVPENIVLALYNKYSSVSGASTATALPATADTTDNQIRFTVATSGKRDLTIVRPL